MNTEEKSKLLVYLQQTIDNLNNTVESLREELRQSREQKEELLRGQADLRSALNVLSQSLLSAESAQKKAESAQKKTESVIERQARHISDLRDQLKRNNKAQFGSKSQKKRQGNDEPPTHGESKDQFDGTSGSNFSSARIRWQEPRQCSTRLYRHAASAGYRPWIIYGPSSGKSYPVLRITPLFCLRPMV